MTAGCEISLHHEVAFFLDYYMQVLFVEQFHGAGVLIGANNVNKLKVLAKNLVNFFKFKFYFHKLLTRKIG